MIRNFNLIGSKFGRLTVLRFVEIRRGRAIYVCRCECGTEFEAKAKYLCNGDTKSCGCLKIDTSRRNGKATATHGLTNHPMYKVWSSMKDRCLNSRCHAYPDYGGRGITVAEEWMSFGQFYADMCPTYEKGLELDRGNNDLGYSKSNCRWVTPTINKQNRRKSVFLTVNGVKKHIADWSRETGISRHSIWYRIAEGKEGISALYGVRKLKDGRKKVH